METNVKVKTIFTIYSTLLFIYDLKNKKYLVDSERILNDKPGSANATDDENATPALVEAISRPFLKITTDDLPKAVRGLCVSRQQFALQVVVHYAATKRLNIKESSQNLRYQPIISKKQYGRLSLSFF
ncbi:hypothetical protein F4678DRAFT_452875 [Xylaria arbuscula]|nr:hypothetical protein F4678DRAFT_452875 [Xylaria arbuscula]